MNRIPPSIIFITIFLLIFGWMNYYAVFRLASYLGIQKNLSLHLLTFSLIFSFLIANILDRSYHTLFSKVFYILSSTWLGFVFLLMSVLLVFEVIRFFLPYSQKTIGIIIITIVVLLTLISLINVLFISTRYQELQVPHLKKELRIVQLTDLHIGTIHNEAFLKKVIQKTSSLKPDIVVITGDLVDGTASLHPAMFDLFNSINAPIYYVTGNHEMYEGLDNVFKALNTSNIIPLRNEMKKAKGIQIIGVDYSGDKKQLEKILPQLDINTSQPSLLLYHPPDGLETAATYNISLMLSGHTHNGQIFPFTLLVKLRFPYIRGLYNIGNTYLYTSPGTGTWGPPMRLGSRNEITVFDLKAE